MAKARILVVEDEIIVAQDIQMTLTQLGYEVCATVISGEAALACLDETRPDLVLMDIHLAGKLDGVATAERIRQRMQIPIIYLTAHSDEATLQRANITEPYGYILKPFEERELSIAIDIALYRHETEQKLRQMERWMASTLKSMGDAVLTTDLQGKITFMNQIAGTLTGWDKREVLVGTFSKGMKQKLAIARALIHDPEVLFLDEPTANLDPESSKTVRDFILDLKKEKKTIFLNTHNLDEAHKICDKIGIFNTKLMAIGSPEELEESVWSNKTVIQLEQINDKILKALYKLSLKNITTDNNKLIIDVVNPKNENPIIVDAIVGAGGHVQYVTRLSPTLEDAYFKFVRG